MGWRLVASILLAMSLSGCALDQIAVGPQHPLLGEELPFASQAVSPWADATVVATAHTVGAPDAASDEAYKLDSGDKLRIFVYGQPNLSRVYTVDQSGLISVPLIGAVKARGLTTFGVERAIRDRLSADFVRDAQVTVDVQQARPFFILGEVRNAGQYPFVPGLTIEAAVAIAGGYSERASAGVFRVTRKTGRESEEFEAPRDFPLRAGDTIYVFERIF